MNSGEGGEVEAPNQDQHHDQAEIDQNGQNYQNGYAETDSHVQAEAEDEVFEQVEAQTSKNHHDEVLVDDDDDNEGEAAVGEPTEGDEETSPVKRGRPVEGDEESEEVVQGKRAKMDGESLVIMTEASTNGIGTE
jgi:hypothetical protein